MIFFGTKKATRLGFWLKESAEWSREDFGVAKDLIGLLSLLGAMEIAFKSPDRAMEVRFLKRRSQIPQKNMSMAMTCMKV